MPSRPLDKPTTDSWRASVLDLLLANRIEAQLRRGPSVVVERFARGGGNTAWYRLDGPGDVPRLINELRPGSDVRFAFDERFTEGIFDGRMAALVAAIAADHVNAVILAVGDNFELEHDFPSSAAEAREFAAGLPTGCTVLVGRFPDYQGIVLPDYDGIVRPHPH